MEDQRFRILCVDDEPDILDAIRRTFRKHYDVVAADSGRAAIELLGTTRVDLIICDQRMPDVTGDQVLKFARETQPEAIRILLTGYSDMESLINAVNEAGIYKYLSKPWEPEMLRLTVVRALETLSLERNLKAAGEQLKQSYMNAVTMLSFACEGKDEDTGFHVQRIQRYTERLALQLGMLGGQAEHMGVMSILHDIGKLSIPDAILKKPGKLDDEEWRIMRMHPEYGVKILGQLPFYEGAREIAGGHHEKWDGSGYPNGLAGDAIPRAARIVHVADVFDALTSRRPYKEAWPLDRALAEMRAQTGKQFDPTVMRAFLELVDGGVIAEIMHTYAGGDEA